MARDIPYIAAVNEAIGLELARDETRHETTQDKPSAGIKWAKGSGQRRKTLWRSVKKSALPQGGRKDGEKSLQAQNDKHE